jgi:hypothetical protein
MKTRQKLTMNAEFECYSFFIALVYVYCPADKEAVVSLSKE